MNLFADTIFSLAHLACCSFIWVIYGAP